VLIGLFPPRIEYLPSASDYLSFSAFFLLACGIAFQLPCMLVLLVSLRVISAESLRRQRKVAWFILFAFAEIVTPIADPIVARAHRAGAAGAALRGERAHRAARRRAPGSAGAARRLNPEAGCHAARAVRQRPPLFALPVPR
jgi:hypothetical protein